MKNYWFSIRKRGFFRPGKEIKGLRGGVHQYAAQVTPQIDAAKAENDRFRMKTKYRLWKLLPFTLLLMKPKLLTLRNISSRVRGVPLPTSGSGRTCCKRYLGLSVYLRLNRSIHLSGSNIV